MIHRCKSSVNDLAALQVDDLALWRTDCSMLRRAGRPWSPVHFDQLAA